MLRASTSLNIKYEYDAIMTQYDGHAISLSVSLIKTNASWNRLYNIVQIDLFA